MGEAPPVVLDEDAVRRQQAQHPIERAGVRAAGRREFVHGPRIVVQGVGHAELGRPPQRAGRHHGGGDFEDADIGGQGGGHRGLGHARENSRARIRPADTKSG